MNKPAIVALAVVAVLSAAAASVASVQVAYAQYGNQQAGISQEQLDRCAELGIDKTVCSESTILQKEKFENIQNNLDNPDKGSGTNYFSGNETYVYIGILAAIFGGVAAMFFIKGRGGSPPS